MEPRIFAVFKGDKKMKEFEIPMNEVLKKEMSRKPSMICERCGTELTKIEYGILFCPYCDSEEQPGA